MTLIQGPPGSAKTTVTSVAVSELLEANHRVLVCTYTQHALDNIVDAVASFVRNTRFLPLRRAASKKCETRPWVISDLPIPDWVSNKSGVKERHELRESMQDLLERVVCPVFKKYIDSADVKGPFKDFFKSESYKPSSAFRYWLTHASPGKSSPPSDLWKIPIEKRMKYYHDTILPPEDLLELHSTWNEILKLNESLNETESDENVNFFACTTQYAAKNMAKLEAFNFDTLIIEEAGELREVHSLACIPSSVKKIVLVGDHMQLRPKVNVYQLTAEAGKGFRSDISLFERLFQCDVASSQTWKFVLDTQYRMPTSLRQFCTILGYKDLRSGLGEKHFPLSPLFLDAESAKLSNGNIFELSTNGADGTERAHYKHKSVIAKSRLRFFHHQFPEGGADMTSLSGMESKSNIGEATFLICHLLKMLDCGILPSNITILTPYLGQVRLLRALLKNVGIETTSDERTLIDLKKEDMEVEDTSLSHSAFSGTTHEESGGLKLREGVTYSDFTKPELWPSVGSSDDIANALKALKRAKLEGFVKVSSVDNFQGEENDHILLSLVRSNKDGKIGFLGNSNRLIVALSRQRLSLTLFGNARMFQVSPVWNDILRVFLGDLSIHYDFKFVCPVHHNIVKASLDELIQLSASENAATAPSSKKPNAKVRASIDIPKCAEICYKMRACKHECVSFCHSGTNCPPCQESVTVEDHCKCDHKPTLRCPAVASTIVKAFKYREYIVSPAYKRLRELREKDPKSLECRSLETQALKAAYICTHPLSSKCRTCPQLIAYFCNDGTSITPNECGPCRKKREDTLKKLLAEQKRKEEEEMKEAQEKLEKLKFKMLNGSSSDSKEASDSNHKNSSPFPSTILSKEVAPSSGGAVSASTSKIGLLPLDADSEPEE